MSIKLRTITLSHPHANPNDRDGKHPLYRVERITDSIEYSPGACLSKDEVSALCAASGWKVAIVPVKGK